MPTVPRWRNLLAHLPPWLRTGEGGAVDYVFGLIHDELTERMRLALHARFPGHPECPPDAYALIGRDRVISRGPNETQDAYAIRLQQWLDTHRRAGSPQVLAAALRAYFTPHAVRIRIVNVNGDWYSLLEDGTERWRLRAPNWNWDGNPAAWSRFWVLVYPLDTSAFERASDFDEPGDVFVDESDPDPVTWDSSLTVSQVDSLRGIIRSAWAQVFGTKCEGLLLVWDASAFDPAGSGVTYPDGEWGDWEKVVSFVSQPTRSTLASYVDV